MPLPSDVYRWVGENIVSAIHDRQLAEHGGPNGLQNFPVITSALVTGSTKTIAGTLNSTVGDQFEIDFYANAACDPSGNGEGQTYLGSITTSATDSVLLMRLASRESWAPGVARSAVRPTEASPASGPA